MISSLVFIRFVILFYLFCLKRKIFLSLFIQLLPSLNMLFDGINEEVMMSLLSNAFKFCSGGRLMCLSVLVEGQDSREMLEIVSG